MKVACGSQSVGYQQALGWLEGRIGGFAAFFIHNSTFSPGWLCPAFQGTTAASSGHWSRNSRALPAAETGALPLYRGLRQPVQRLATFNASQV